jgi:hypothetical protein
VAATNSGEGDSYSLLQFFPIGLDIAVIYDHQYAESPSFPVDGQYSLGLFPYSFSNAPPGFGGPFSLSQVGDVPADARSIHFLNFGGQFEMRVNDILVPLAYVYPPDYHTFAADQMVGASLNRMSDVLRPLVRRCWPKEQHASAGAAEAQMRSRLRRGLEKDPDRIRVYRCTACGFHHVGHR